MAKPPPHAFRLDLGRYELRRIDGVKVKIERQPMELLILLAEKKHQLVTREEVAARLWPAGISVETEPAINNAIRKIRTALRDSPECPAHLETVVGKGYRFIGDVEVIREEPPPLPPPAPRPPAPLLSRISRAKPALAGIAIVVLAGGAFLAPILWRSWRTTGLGTIHSLAVLPLQNLSGDPAQNYLAEGIADELTTDLAKIGSLRVISRTSTMRYAEHRPSTPQVAKELNVDAVIEGSIVRSGDRVRITAQLIDARRDAHLWAQSYERDLREIIELEDSVALDIATQVKASLSPETRRAFTARYTVKPEAYEAYLRGRSEIGRQNQGAIRNSVQYFQQAIDLDPLYAAAYAGLGDSFSLMANYAVLAPKESFPRAEAAARKALELDPSSAEAHASLAFARHHFDWDWSGAEAGYRRALELSPGFSLAHLRYAEYLSNAGRHEEALREINRARELDPLSVTIDSNVGRVLFYAWRYDDAIRELRTSLGLHPDRFYTRIYLGMALEQKRMYPQAIAEFERANALVGSDPGVGYAQALALAGQAADARQALRDHVEKPNDGGVLDWVFIAGVYTALGDRDGAFAWLARAEENRDFFLTYLNVDPFLDPLRSDARFAALLQRVGIPGH